jgi:predicted membrane protein DUF2157
MHARTRVPPAADHPLGELDRHLDTWSQQHLITPQQAGAIWAFEASKRFPPAATTPRTAPVTEALAYLGASLAAAAVGVVVGQTWSDVPSGVRMAVPAAIAIALWILGWVTRRSTAPAVVRLAHVAWFLSTGAVAWCVAVVAIDGFDATDRWPLLWTGAATSAFAIALYLARPAALQQVVSLVALSLLAGGVLFHSVVAIWSVIWALGALWILLAWRGWLAGRATAFTVGAVATLVAAIAVPANAGNHWMWVGIVNAAVLIGVAVALRQTPMLVLAAIGLFQSTVGTIGRYLGGGIGAAIGLLAAGLLVLAVALAIARHRRTPPAPIAS